MSLETKSSQREMLKNSNIQLRIRKLATQTALTFSVHYNYQNVILDSYKPKVQTAWFFRAEWRNCHKG